MASKHSRMGPTFGFLPSVHDERVPTLWLGSMHYGSPRRPPSQSPEPTQRHIDPPFYVVETESTVLCNIMHVLLLRVLSFSSVTNQFVLLKPIVCSCKAHRVSIGLRSKSLCSTRFVVRGDLLQGVQPSSTLSVQQIQVRKEALVVGQAPRPSETSSGTSS